jgi:hypothetical protein
VQGHRVRDLSDSQTFFTVPLETLGAGRQLLQTPDTLGGGRRLRQAPAEAEADVLDDATIGIFSAYHDPILAEVRIFTEVHPRGVCPKFHRCACIHRHSAGRVNVGKTAKAHTNMEQCHIYLFLFCH